MSPPKLISIDKGFRIFPSATDKPNHSRPKDSSRMDLFYDDLMGQWALNRENTHEHVLW